MINYREQCIAWSYTVIGLRTIAPWKYDRTVPMGWLKMCSAYRFGTQWPVPNESLGIPEQALSERVWNWNREQHALVTWHTARLQRPWKHIGSEDIDTQLESESSTESDMCDSIHWYAQDVQGIWKLWLFMKNPYRVILINESLLSHFSFVRISCDDKIR